MQAFAARLKDAPIDILVANAAVAQPEYKLTKDGWEETYVLPSPPVREYISDVSEAST